MVAYPPLMPSRVDISLSTSVIPLGLLDRLASISEITLPKETFGWLAVVGTPRVFQRNHATNLYRHMYCVQTIPASIS